MENKIEENEIIDEKIDKKLLAAIEAVLFVYGETLEIKRLVGILKRDEKLNLKTKEAEEIVKKALEKLRQKYEAEDSGLKIIFSENRVQLATKPDFIPLLEDFIKEEFKENLTPASVETLSLIAYLGPLSRAQIDYYRGVNSSFILRSLMIRGLIERKTDPKRANVYLYQVSFELLKDLGISKIEELPEYEKFRAIEKKEDNQ